MKEYYCDICGKKLSPDNKCIQDKYGQIRFHAIGKPSRESYAGFNIELKSNSVRDMRTKCVIDAVIQGSLK